MLRNPGSRYVPVALLDDDPDKRRLSIMGVPVVGDRQAIAEAAHRYRADAFLLAVPSAPAEVVREISKAAADAGLTVRVLPPVSELLAGTVGVDDIRAPTEVDLLGRHHIETDVAQIARHLTGRRILVTGAGGSIGSELCRQLARFRPEALVMLDRDESALHAVQLSIDGRADLDSPHLVVADIRDRERIFEVFEEHRPAVVFHAAALKHVPLLERHVHEALKTNIAGTLGVLDAAMEHGVERFVTISTDKAADPANVLGFTKRIAERLTAAAGLEVDAPFVSVRFGNVLGSRGSVLETFRRQIEEGGPVTVTAPDVTRYFMTVNEAVELTIQASVVGRAGEVLVLEMGKPVHIVDVARQLVDASGRSIDIRFVGLRAGEKVHETLLARGEVGERPSHPLIEHVRVPPLPRDVVDRLHLAPDPSVLRRELERLCVATGSSIGARSA